ncbi:hypothetical protein BKA58DRAFT_3781 [Alternaria rosae]|uniref:uncharacterized protein n=1 Tax=Alternaria rosae TaxID=1187941 RepID=UPI001E8D3064|nr:uncharacterized protein BKA58DRAFT_3781 [Alternaria rosae]KAH6881515.1 hypothetical protein BKA58DRAFT_3781 [Alternaria rosae]
MAVALLLAALLGPTMVYAAAFSLPEATQYTPTMDGWSPAPTAAPQLPFDLSRRQDIGANTCGFVSGSGLSVSAIICPNLTDVCSSNNYFGALGCCPSSRTTDCMIATSCVPSTALSASCTDTTCSPNAAILKCTESSAPACYEWRVIYDRIVFTQHGCAASAFTGTAYHSLDMSLSSNTPEKETVYATVTKEPVSTPTSAPPPSSSNTSKSSLGAIVGGTIGACLFLSFFGFVIFLTWRRRRAQARNTAHSTGSFHQRDSRGMVEYNAMGFPSPGFMSQGLSSPESPSGEVDKVWQQRGSGGEWPGMERQIEIVEVDGTSRPVEVPAGER